MPNLDKLFKDEIRRIARSEAKAAIIRLKGSIAKLKDMLRELKGQLQTPAKAAPEASPERPDDNAEVTPHSIKSHRERLGLSINKFAQVLGVNNNSIFNWEHGKTKPTPVMIKKLQAVRYLSKQKAESILASGTPAPAARAATQAVELTPQAVQSMRENLGLNINKFARILEVNYNSVLNWEHGRARPKPAMVKKLLAVGNLDKREVESILAGKEPDSKKTPKPANEDAELTPLAVKSLREDLGLSKSEFAAKLGVSYNSVFNWESAETKPSPAMVEKIWAVARPASAE